VRLRAGVVRRRVTRTVGRPIAIAIAIAIAERRRGSWRVDYCRSAAQNGSFEVMDSMRFVLVLVGVAGCGPGDANGACAHDESPFLQTDCLAELRLACNEHDAEESCLGADSRSFESGHDISCAWVEVATFSDETTCALDSTVGRCEAVVGLLGCLDTCNAIPSEGEIFDLCGGPIGPWSAIDSEDDHVATCSSNVQLPAPALCECAPMVCSDV
jgi:hypothetical protein